MKTLKLLPLFLVAFLFCNYTAVAQEEEEDEEDEVVEEVATRIIGTYTGVEDGAFVFTHEDENGEENTISFEKVSPLLKGMYDLSDKKLVGKKFQIEYITENVVDEDDEEMLTSERTIISLTKL
ncbi:hypothetical protein ACFQ1M_12165 [Sungkyunkwania multivorans]|uniref:Uncharacterized protein n=1 Tax=Sungkyunkwania multivorans TaxID=1173618 RepID=A0ABW3CZJ8_9FLAO